MGGGGGEGGGDDGWRDDGASIRARVEKHERRAAWERRRGAGERSSVGRRRPRARDETHPWRARAFERERRARARSAGARSARSGVAKSTISAAATSTLPRSSASSSERRANPVPIGFSAQFQSSVPGGFGREKRPPAAVSTPTRICFERLGGPVVAATPSSPPIATRTLPAPPPATFRRPPPPPPKKKPAAHHHRRPADPLESSSLGVDRRRPPPPRRTRRPPLPAVAVPTGGATGPFVFFSSRRRTPSSPSRASVSHGVLPRPLLGEFLVPRGSVCRRHLGHERIAGLGSHSNEQMDSSTLEMVSAGLHCSLRMSRQDAPLAVHVQVVHLRLEVHLGGLEHG